MEERGIELGYTGSQTNDSVVAEGLKNQWKLLSQNGCVLTLT